MVGLRKITKERVLAVAAVREFFVPKYGYHAEALRKMTRRMRNDGELTLICADKRGFFYRTPKK